VVGELIAIAALFLTALGAVGLAIWQARKSGAAGAERDALDQAVKRATDATQERAAVDRMSDAAVVDELRRDHSR
jgi:hypothetical protein